MRSSPCSLQPPPAENVGRISAIAEIRHCVIRELTRFQGVTTGLRLALGRELLPGASLAFPRFGWYSVLKAEPHELIDETRTEYEH